MANNRNGGARRVLSGGDLAERGGDRRGQDAPERQRAEESLPAGVAPVGGESEPSLQGDHGATLDPVGGNMFEVKIPATRAVRVTRERHRHHRSMKSQIARMTSPGPQPNHGGEIVERAAAVGPKTVDASALWANHGLVVEPLLSARQNTESARSKQVSRQSLLLRDQRSFGSAAACCRFLLAEARFGAPLLSP